MGMSACSTLYLWVVLVWDSAIRQSNSSVNLGGLGTSGVELHVFTRHLRSSGFLRNSVNLVQKLLGSSVD